MFTHCTQVLVQKCACMLYSFIRHMFIECPPRAMPCAGTGNTAVNKAAGPHLVYILVKYLQTHTHNEHNMDAESAGLFHAQGSQKG